MQRHWGEGGREGGREGGVRFRFDSNGLFEEGLALEPAEVLVERAFKFFHAKALRGGREGGREGEFLFMAVWKC